MEIPGPRKITAILLLTGNIEVDIAGFTEDIHADMFTGDPRWKTSTTSDNMLGGIRRLRTLPV